MLVSFSSSIEQKYILKYGSCLQGNTTQIAYEIRFSKEGFENKHRLSKSCES
jgi:hypothetical protein